jgi:hypothetical protein
VGPRSVASLGHHRVVGGRDGAEREGRGWTADETGSVIVDSEG